MKKIDGIALLLIGGALILYSAYQAQSYPNAGPDHRVQEVALSSWTVQGILVSTATPTLFPTINGKLGRFNVEIQNQSTDDYYCGHNVEISTISTSARLGRKVGKNGGSWALTLASDLDFYCQSDGASPSRAAWTQLQ